MMKMLWYLLGVEDGGSITRVLEHSLRTAVPLAGWVVIVGVVWAVVAAGLNLLPQSVMRWRTRMLLTGIRLAGFALLLLMVAQLELHLRVERTLRPNVAILTDVSESMDLRDVGGKSRLEAARAFGERIKAGLGERVNVLPYRFNWKLEADDGKGATAGGMTRLVDSLQELAGREADVQGAIVLTDGNDRGGNRGELVMPVLASRGVKVYPVVFGESKGGRPASVKMAGGGAYVRLGDEFRLTATLTGSGAGEQVVIARLMEEGKKEAIAAKENIRLGKEPVDVSFAIKPESAGAKTYRVVMEGVKDAVSERMLVAEHKVQVLNSRIKVLYLDVPRDERKILGHWLSRDPVMDVAMLTLMPKGGWYAQGGPGVLMHKNAGDGLPNEEADLYKYDVVILGDIPRGYFREGGDVAETKMQRLVEFVLRRGGGLITLGGRSVYGAGNYQDSSLARILPFSIEATTEEMQIPKLFKIAPTAAGLSHPLMQLEFEGQANRDAWLDLPTLEGSNRVGKAKAGASVLATREMEGGSMPVVALQSVGKGQVLSLAVDTTWRWEMMRPDEGEDYFRRFWGNAVRALAPDPRVQPNQPQVMQFQSSTPTGQTVTLGTRLVDSTFRPLTGAEVVVKVTSPGGKVTMIYPRDGRASPGLYEYSIPLTEGGAWQVAVTHKDKTVNDVVMAGTGEEELDDPRAKPEAMEDLAKATGGRTFTATEADALVESLQIKPRAYSQATSIPLWNLPITMVVMIGLVCVDTWLRKRRGMV